MKHHTRVQGRRLRPSQWTLVFACAYLCELPLGAADPTRMDVASAAARHGARSSNADERGIWKATVPPAGTMRGEFANNDPIGLAAGMRIAADCSINWVNPDDGKLYCFSSATSLVVFLEAPHAYLSRARAEWQQARGPAH